MWFEQAFESLSSQKVNAMSLKRSENLKISYYERIWVIRNPAVSSIHLLNRITELLENIQKLEPSARTDIEFYDM